MCAVCTVSRRSGWRPRFKNSFKAVFLISSPSRRHIGAAICQQSRGSACSGLRCAGLGLQAGARLRDAACRSGPALPQRRRSRTGELHALGAALLAVSGQQTRVAPGSPEASRRVPSRPGLGPSPRLLMDLRSACGLMLSILHFSCTPGAKAPATAWKALRGFSVGCVGTVTCFFLDEASFLRSSGSPHGDP